jgi:cell division protein FtsI (penicillin-binding protein 3)
MPHMRTVSSGHQQEAGTKADFSAFLLGAALRAAHFFPLAIGPEERWMTYQRWRSLGVFTLLLGFGGMLSLHLYVLQFDATVTTANLGELNRRWHSYDTPQAKRGNILYRDGTLLAGNRKAGRIIVEPDMVSSESMSGLCATLARATGQTTEKLMQRCLRPGAKGVVVADGLTLETAQEIDHAKMRGVFVRYYFERNYPHGEYGAATVVGYAGREDVHRLGLEKKWNDELTGEDGNVQYARDCFRRRLPDTIQATNPKPGKDLITTLDPAVQLICETELREAHAKNKSDWGCILVMEPTTGEIRGAATYPTFDPNEYMRGRIGNEMNVITQTVVEPGSTLKPLLAAAAIDRGWVPETRTYRCPNGFKVKNHVVREAEADENIGGADGIATLQEIIVHSSNVGMAQLALELGQARVLEGLEQYGFFERTGIELPGEAKGFRPNYYAGRNSRWPKILVANSGFGQGLAVTPLQLCGAYCALANGGYRVRPTIVAGLEEASTAPALPSGETLLASIGVHSARAASTEAAKARPAERILRPETCSLMDGWLADVVTKGTGKNAKLDRFNAGGKTGTAQIPSPTGGYKSGKYTAGFCGFFPVERPKYVILVMFGEPKGLYYGGSVAAPVFKAVGDRISFLQEGLTTEAPHAPR